MRVTELEHWLQATIGLDAATLGPNAIKRAVDIRMAACSLHDPADYLDLVRSALTEQQALIEAVIIPETSFFRDADAFTALARVYDAQWASAHLDVPLRMLSLPCSSGEEPYSMAMAMALLDGGFPAERLCIDGIDISELALDKARRGLYGGNSFRGHKLQYRERHFEAVAGGWQVSAAVRRLVRFRWGNALAVDQLPGAASYDAIFCRNLLIYFDQDTQHQVVGALAKLLRADGLIFVGPSETGLMLHQGFNSAHMPMAFAFRKPGATPTVSLSRSSRPSIPARSTDAFVAAGNLAATMPLRVTGNTVGVVASPKPAASLLEDAQRLADAGQFSAAASACEACLTVHGPSARVFYLLGLVEGASGDQVRAEGWFRKALYLQPDHEEALIHLALALENKGDINGGRVLRLRAKRHRETAG